MAAVTQAAGFVPVEVFAEPPPQSAAMVALPEPKPKSKPERQGGGRPAGTGGIEITLAGGARIMYILSTGCQWRYIPKDLPPRSTLHEYMGRWYEDNTLTAIHHALYVRCRELEQRDPSPTACIIDSQSVKSTEKGGASRRPNRIRRRENDQR
jgi:transposase